MSETQKEQHMAFRRWLCRWFGHGRTIQLARSRYGPTTTGRGGEDTAWRCLRCLASWCEAWNG